MAEQVALQLLGPSTGGIRRHVSELTRILPDLGWRAPVAGPAGVGLGVDLSQIAEVRVPSGPNPRALLQARAALRRVSRDVDLVHAHGLKAGWIASLAGIDLPLVVTVHNLVLDETGGHGAGVLRRLEGWLPSRVDAVIAVSEEIAVRFGGPTETVRVIMPAGPLPAPDRDADAVRRALRVSDDAPLIVSVARLHPQKDLLTLIDAAGLLRQELSDVRVAIVGEGPLERELRAAVESRGLGDTVLLVGPSANAADEMAAADAVVITSLWESGPLVAAEALQLGRPLVATPVGFIPRLVEDGVSGRLVAVGDARAVADALLMVLRDPAGAAAMATSGRRRVQDLLGPRQLVADVASVYDEVLDRRRVSR